MENNNHKQAFSIGESELDSSTVNFFNVRKKMNTVKNAMSYLRNQFDDMRAMTKKIAQRQNDLTEKESQLAMREAKLVKREAKLAEREAKLAEREAKLAERDNELLDEQETETYENIEKQGPQNVALNIEGESLSNLNFSNKLSELMLLLNQIQRRIEKEIQPPIDTANDRISTEVLFEIEGQVLANLEMKLATFGDEEQPYGAQQCKELICNKLTEAVNVCKEQGDCDEWKMIVSFVREIADKFDWLLYDAGEFEYEFNIEDDYSIYQDAIPKAAKDIIEQKYNVDLVGIVRALLDNGYLTRLYHTGIIVCNGSNAAEKIDYMREVGRIKLQDKDQYQYPYIDNRDRN